MKLDSRVSGDSRFSIDGTCGFLSDIDPYKAVDNMGKRYLTFSNRKTQEECIGLLKEYLKNHLDLSEITKGQNE